MRGAKRMTAFLVVFGVLAGSSPAWAGRHGRIEGALGVGYYGYYPIAGFFPYGVCLPGNYYSAASEVRLQVKPDQARVFVDGYYAGIVDDFDGLFQRLRLPPGRHELTLKFTGFKTHRILMYAAVGRTLKIRYEMIPGTGQDEPDELAPTRPVPEPGEGPIGVPGKRAERHPEGGEIRLSVRPEDASVYLDGAFRGSGRELHSVELAAGRHRIEVVRPGFRTYEREVEVEPDRELDVTVELQRP
jgi:hypothetical protein